MNVTETRADGLQRELKVTIPAAALDEKLTAYLDDMRTKVRLKGFRPGKVPMAHLRKVYGKSAMAEVVNEVLTKKNLRGIITRILRAAGHAKTARFLDNMKNLGFGGATEAGLSFSLADIAGMAQGRDPWPATAD